MSATTRTAVELFTEYRLDSEAALEPCVHCLLSNCPEGELETLYALLEAYVPEESPPYSPVQMRRKEVKLRPLLDRVFNDPAVIAGEDQRDAQWRDTPWWRKRYLRGRFWLLCVRIRVKNFGKPPRWE